MAGDTGASQRRARVSGRREDLDAQRHLDDSAVTAEIAQLGHPDGCEDGRRRRVGFQRIATAGDKRRKGLGRNRAMDAR